MRQQLKVLAARTETIFPLAVHWGWYIRCGIKSTVVSKSPIISFVGEVPSVTAMERFTKPFNVTPAVVFLISELHLLSQAKQLAISEKVVLSL